MKINLANIKKAKKLLDKDDCVAVPTETVYGLAGNAYSDGTSTAIRMFANVSVNPITKIKLASAPSPVTSERNTP